MKISKLVLTSVLALAVFSLSIGSGLAQAPKKNGPKPKNNFEQSYPQSSRGGERNDYSRPAPQGHQPKASGGKQQQQQHNQGRNQDYRSDYGNNKPKPGPNLNENRPGSHQGLNYQTARNMAESGKMTGYKPLPPQVRRDIAVGRPLPGHLQAKPVPPYMLKQLPSRPGYEWRISGTDLLLVAAGTFIVYQIIENVFY